MSNLKVMMKQIVNHVDEGDLMTALDFFESSVLPYHKQMDPTKDQELYDLVTKLDGTVENEDWNESLEIVDEISEMLDA